MKKKGTQAAGLHAHAETKTPGEKKRRRLPTETIVVDTKDARGGTKTSSNVIYIGHIPHGFYEKQMQAFFSQFGQVSQLRLSRNKKTGKSKHYGFVQFMSSEVAEIVADAMNGYHFFGQKLDVKVLQKADVHPEIFKGANRTFKRIPWREIEVKRHNKERTEKEEEKRKKRAQKSALKRAKKITAAGIDYSYDDVDSDNEDAPTSTKDKKSVETGKEKKGAPKGKPASSAKEQTAKPAKTRVTKSLQKAVSPPGKVSIGKKKKVADASQAATQRVTRSRAKAQ